MPKFTALTRIRYNDEIIEEDKSFECSEEEGKQLVDVGAAKRIITRKRKPKEETPELKEEAPTEKPFFS